MSSQHPQIQAAHTSAQERLAGILQRIQQACERAHRPTDSVQLLAVSKTFPAESILDMRQAGQTRFGENYLQEALDKITQLAGSPIASSLEWHFIGPIQSNKTRPMAEHFDWVHSVDRLKIAQRLSEQRPAALPPLNVLLQVNTSGEASKSGVPASELTALARQVHALPHLNVRGLMTIPSNTDDLERLRAEFMACKNLFDGLQEAGIPVDTLSMGMSSDLELAIECGSTCVRVGTALFGQRPPQH